MKKRVYSLLLALLLVFGLTVSASAASSEAKAAADNLYTLGLFKGTGTNADGTPIYDLDKTPTRNQAIIMLVRLLGKEEAALKGSWNLPFTDVAKNSTAYPYIGYAYANGLTNGTTATTYSGTAPIRANQYITFVLRALGYVSGEDFQVSTAWTFSDDLGLTDGTYHAATTQFTRGDVAKISNQALVINKKGTTTSLLNSLVASGAVEYVPVELSLSGGKLPTWEEYHAQSEYKPDFSYLCANGKYYQGLSSLVDPAKLDTLVKIVDGELYCRIGAAQNLMDIAVGNYIVSSTDVTSKFTGEISWNDSHESISECSGEYNHITKTYSAPWVCTCNGKTLFSPSAGDNTTSLEKGIRIISLPLDGQLKPLHFLNVNDLMAYFGVKGSFTYTEKDSLLQFPVVYFNS